MNDTEKGISFPPGEPRRDRRVEEVERTPLGNRLREIRLYFGLTQREIGREMGVTPEIVSRLERQGRNPQYKMLRKLAEIYEMTHDDLVYLLNTDVPFARLIRDLYPPGGEEDEVG